MLSQYICAKPNKPYQISQLPQEIGLRSSKSNFWCERIAFQFELYISHGN